VISLVKIVMLTYYSFLEVQGGAPLYTYRIAEHLAKKGFKVVVFCRGRMKENKGINYNGIYVKQYLKLKFRYSKYQRIIDRSVFYVFEILRDFINECKDAEVVHIISHSFSFPFGFLCKKILKRRLVISIIENVFYKGDSLIENLFLTYQRWQLKVATKYSDILTVEDLPEIKDLNVSKSQKFMKKVKLLHNFVDTDLFNPFVNSEMLKDKLNYQDYKIILIVGSLTRNKAPEIAIKAMSYVLNVIPKAKLLIIGTGPLREYLVQLTEKLNLQDHVTFLGEVKYVDMPKYYALADLVVCPSRTEGGIPAMAAEPMAMGKPVIISEACDAGNLLGNTVRKFKVDDVQSLSKEIIDLLMDQRIADEIGKKSREKILKIASKEKFLKTIDEIYNMLL